VNAAEEAQIVDAVRAAARAEILPRFRALPSAAIHQKSSPHDLVTEADLAAEAALSLSLRAAFPGVLVTGEEAIAAAPSLRPRLGTEARAIVIDPIDGTWNFAHGLATFGVIVAALEYGRPIFGLLYDPTADDWIVARANTPARAASPSGEHQITTAKAKPLDALNGHAGAWFTPRPQRTALVAALSQTDRLTALRSSCHEYRFVAQGHTDYVLSSMLHPWDHAAGNLICQQAGGASRMLDGAPYNAALTQGHLLTASCEETWSALAALIRPTLE